MNYTDEQFAALAPFEDNFRTAIGGEWTRRIRTPDQLRIKEIYEAATKSRIPFNQGCGTCLLNLLRRAGRLYFADKKGREVKQAQPEPTASPATKPETPENTPKTPQISPSRAKKGNGTKTSNKGRKSAKK
jgi:hypothetical protein